MQLPKAWLLRVLGSAVAVALAWGSYTYQLWQRDSKRARIKFAKEMGRQICGCTETGEIMLLDTEDTTPARVYVCPVCKSFHVSTSDKKVAG